jgi:hypothetical protein
MKIKQQGYEADQPLPCNFKVKNKRSYEYNSKLLHVFMTCTVTNLLLLYRLPPIMIPPIFQPHLHHINNFARRVSRHKPTKSGNHIRGHWTESFFHIILFLFSWQLTVCEQSAIKERNNLLCIHYLCTKVHACHLAIYIAQNHTLLRNVSFINR